MPAVLLAGLPGTGKSTLAQALAMALDGHVLSKDQIRWAVFGPKQVAYSAEQDEWVHGVIIEAAQSLWQRDPGLWIVFEGRTYSKRSQREAVPAHYTIVCMADEAVVRERLKEPHMAANRDWALYERVRDEFEPVLEPHLLINTGEPFEECLQMALTYLTTAQGT